MLAGTLVGRQLLIELFAGGRLIGHQPFDPFVIFLCEDELGLRGPQRGSLCPQTGDPVTHLFLLPLDPRQASSSAATDERT